MTIGKTLVTEIKGMHCNVMQDNLNFTILNAGLELDICYASFQHLHLFSSSKRETKSGGYMPWEALKSDTSLYRISMPYPWIEKGIGTGY